MSEQDRISPYEINTMKKKKKKKVVGDISRSHTEFSELTL